MKKQLMTLTVAFATSMATLSSQTWQNVGTAFAGEVWYTSLAFSPGGEPYVAYADAANSWETTVMKFDGTAWVNVGTPGFSEYAPAYICLAFSPDGEPYVAYSDGGWQGRATLMKFDGTAWVYVGMPGFSEWDVANTSLAFSPDGEPYVAYWDGASEGRATVMKFDGTVWATVGTAGFSAGATDFTSLAFSPDGEPYVAYSDVINSVKATVMKFDGTAWATVGTAGFSAGDASYTSLAFSSDGEPYVAYNDMDPDTEFRLATVMKFAATTGINETAFENSVTVYPNPAYDFVTITEIPNGSTLKVMDITGKTVYNAAVTYGQTTTISTTGLVNGIYIIRIENSGTVANRKLVVNR